MNNKVTNIQNCKQALDAAGIKYKSTPSGNEIIFGKKNIQINHNGAQHWTIRVPGAARDGIRLKFGLSICVAQGLFIINDTIAIKYDD